MAKILQECIIVSKEINDKFILAKNRDRAYNPSLEIIHTIIDGIEVLDSMEKVSIGEKFRPVTDIKINKITIHANPLAG